MILNYIWIGFFLIGFLVALIHFFNEWIIWGDYLAGSDVFDKIVKGIFSMAEMGFTLSLGLAGVLNFSANMLGLDNAATPLGLKAMDHLQELNSEKDKATNSMIMFLVLNTSGLTIIPFTIMSFRAQHFA